MNIIAMGTGHRLQDLPCGFDFKHPWKLKKLKQTESYLTNNPPSVIISGMAVGWDQFLGFLAIKLGIPLKCFIPFKGQERLWGENHKKQFEKILDKAQEVRYICDEGYQAWKMHKRNTAMIEESNTVFALWNPQKKFGGTFSTVSQAYSMNRPILNFWGDKVEPVIF